MRMRSNTIYAESFEEFMSISNKADAAVKDTMPSRRVTLAHLDEDDEGDLGVNNDYVARKPLEVIEAEEEEELTEQINQMNISYHKSNKDLLDESYSTKETCYSLKEEQDKSFFFSQNVAIESQTLKYLIIGDRRTGKSTLIDSFQGVTNDSYLPTQSLEIKKAYYNHNKGERVKLEFWDTSRPIIDSKLIQTYMKIANGFIFICDIADRSSISFIKEQIEKVLNASSSKNYNNMFFYLNISSLCTQVNGEEIKSNMELFSSITDRYHIGMKRINALNLRKYSPNSDGLFKEFVNSCVKGLD